tara:strand:+ start:164 stop:418 length:255 start_codon:yes stop_codon:yes gene_type:complete
MFSSKFRPFKTVLWQVRQYKYASFSRYGRLPFQRIQISYPSRPIFFEFLIGIIKKIGFANGGSVELYAIFLLGFRVSPIALLTS